MDLELKDKVAIVGGGSKGLGAALERLGRAEAPEIERRLLERAGSMGAA